MISQSRPGGSVVAKDTEVTITVSKGPDLVEVPNVIGKSRNEAEAAIEAVGLQVRFLGFGRRGGQVYDQEPGPGERVKRGSTVTCYTF